MESWKAKQERAQALVDEIKVEKSKVERAEDVEKLRQKFDDARNLADEARKERVAVESAQLEDLLAEHDRQQEQKENDARSRVIRPAVQPFSQGREIQYATMSERMRPGVRMLASQRFIESIPELQKAALSEGTGSAGGYLVVPAYLQDLFAETRRQGNALRSYGWLNIHPVESNQIYIPKGGGTASVTMVAESGTKPTADQTYSQIAVTVFTAAGISKQSKQLAMDSSPTVLDLSTRELGTLLGNLEEQKVIAGTGTGEPLGILGTAGLAIVPQTASDTAAGAVAAAATAQTIIDRMLDAVVAVTTQYFAPPNGALMHPRRLGFLLKAKDTATNYLFNLAGTFRAPNFRPALDTVTSQSTGNDSPPYSLFGLPIGTSTNIPTNSNYGLTGASDQDTIIVGAWQEAHWFQRQDVTVDTSDVAGTSWETNQVWIRAEERFGFTAARYPTAFAVVHGKGLAVTNT